MPTTNIDYAGAHTALAEEQPNTINSMPNQPCMVSTPFGLSILEIQGELNIPRQAPPADIEVDSEYRASFAKVDEIYDAVRFGRMLFDANDPNKVVLYVGKSQRLLGAVETLREPLGVLRVSRNAEEKEIKIVDVIKKKILFKHRPLPVM